MYKKFNNSKGFTSSLSRGFGILETLLATAVLIMVITAAVYLGNLAIRSSILANERVTAYNLAQEGMEIVRNIRDTNWLVGSATRDWDEWGEGPSTINLNQILIPIKNVATNNWYLKNNNNNPENIDINNTTYKRSIKISKLPNDPDTTYDESEIYRKIVVTVKWDDHGKTYEVSIESYLTNWKPL